jgi:hypothetical protein
VCVCESEWREVREILIRPWLCLLPFLCACVLAGVCVCVRECATHKNIHGYEYCAVLMCFQHHLYK